MIQSGDRQWWLEVLQSGDRQWWLEVLQSGDRQWWLEVLQSGDRQWWLEVLESGLWSGGGRVVCGASKPNSTGTLESFVTYTRTCSFLKLVSTAPNSSDYWLSSPLTFCVLCPTRGDYWLSDTLIFCVICLRPLPNSRWCWISDTLTFCVLCPPASQLGNNASSLTNSVQFLFCILYGRNGNFPQEILVVFREGI